MGVMDQKASLLLLCALSSSQVRSHAPGDGGEGTGEFWKRASEQVFKRSSNGDGTSDALKPPFARVVLELNRLEGMDTMKRGLASLIRPRFGKRNFSSFRMSNRVAAVPEPLHGGAAFDGDSELANLIGLRERLGNEVAVREMLGKRSAPSVGDKVVFEQPKLLLL